MNEAVMDRLREVVLFVAGVIALASLIMAAFEGWHQRINSAVFLGTLGVVCTLIVFLPKLELLKVWGVEARLTRTLDRAEEIIVKLQRLSAISARASYMVIAWGNRMGAPKAKDKQAILDQIDQQLAELNIGQVEREEIVLPFVRMVSFDFYSLYRNVLHKYAQVMVRQQTVDEHAKKEGADEVARVHSEKITAWTRRTENDGIFQEMGRRSLADVLSELTPRQGEWLDDIELRAFDTFKNELLRLNADCIKKGGYTPEAADYYDRYSDNADAKAEEIRSMVLRSRG